MQKIIINNQTIKLKPSQLIQSGGEGMVFDLGQTAVKLYHHPTDQQRIKLHQLLAQAKGWPPSLVGNIFAPCAVVKNSKRQTIGFQMNKLPQQSHPLKKLSSTLFWRKNNVSFTAVLKLLQKIHATMIQLHQNQIIIGDLNDGNIFFAPTLANEFRDAWIDVDSYQFGSFPCPVALESFLDPQLYHVQDFSKRPFFTKLTDWYAFTVLLNKTLLQLHPYGGVHRTHKSLRARAIAQVSFLDTAVNLPSSARPPETLSDDLLHHLHLTFDKGQRIPFPIQMLTHYAHSIINCKQCNLAYPRQRSGCPNCSHQTPIIKPSLTGKIRTIFKTNGFIAYVGLQQNGRLHAIIHHQNQYSLARIGIGGKLDEKPLFSGSPAYRFGYFRNNLIVNPPHKPQLLILDVSNSQPKQIGLIETAWFRETAVFATTPHALYRIAGNWIMRGTVQDGHYVEDAVATAHRAQTNFWASPYNDTIGGLHRIFAEYRFWLRNADGNSYDLAVPQPTMGESVAETAVLFHPASITILRHINSKGKFRIDSHQFDLNGRQVGTDSQTGIEWETAVARHACGNAPIPLDSTTACIQHSAGTILHQPNKLSLLT